MRIGPERHAAPQARAARAGASTKGASVRAGALTKGASVRAGRICKAELDKFDPQQLDAAIVGLALQQHGALALWQLAELGLTRQAVCSRVAAHRLHRIHQGVYALVPPGLLQPLGHTMAAVLACGHGAALSHHSAGSLLNLMQSHRAVIDVTVSSRNGHRRAGIQIHRSSTLRPEDIKRVQGIPCTTPSRTILDLAGVLPRRRLERLLDEAEAEQLFDLEGLVEQLNHNTGRSRAVSALRRVLDEHQVGSTATDNDFGELFLAFSREMGLPDPEVQPWLDLGDGEMMIRPDFVWREQRLIVETDGAKHHDTRLRFEQDRRRDQRAAAAGFQTIRVTKRQLTTDRDRLGQTLRTVVTRSRRRAA